MTEQERVQSIQAARVAAGIPASDSGRVQTWWTCEKWSEDACDFARRKLYLPADAEVGSEQLLHVVGAPEELLVVEGNLLLNEGIQRLLDLLIGAGGVSYVSASAFIGVGDTNTAAAATQTELQAAAAAANRFYKAMVSGAYPARTNQTVDWRSDFTSTEANFVWAEWTICSGTTGASGAGFLTGTTNLNRKVEALGTKSTGTWTLTGSVTIT